MNNISTDLTQKIQKLLRLGTSQNEAESQLALAKAKEMAIRAGIDLASIEVFENRREEEQIEQNSISLGQRKSISQKYISWLLHSHFNVRVVYSGNRRYGQRLVLIGTKTDLEIANYVQAFLRFEFLRLWNEYRERTNAPLEHRNSYIYGLYSGLDTKLSEKTKETEKVAVEEITAQKGAEKANEISQTYALACVNKKERLDTATDQFFPHLRTSRVSVGRLHSSTALSDGISRGKQISLNKALAGGATNAIKY